MADRSRLNQLHEELEQLTRKRNEYNINNPIPPPPSQQEQEHPSSDLMPSSNPLTPERSSRPHIHFPLQDAEGEALKQARLALSLEGANVKRLHDQLEEKERELISLRNIVSDMKKQFASTPTQHYTQEIEELRQELSRNREGYAKCLEEKEILLRKLVLAREKNESPSTNVSVQRSVLHAVHIGTQADETLAVTRDVQGRLVRPLNEADVGELIAALNAEEHSVSLLQARIQEHNVTMESIRAQLVEKLNSHMEKLQGEKEKFAAMLTTIAPGTPARQRASPYRTTSPGRSQSNLSSAQINNNNTPVNNNTTTSSGSKSPIGHLQQEKELRNLRYRLDQLRQLHVLQQTQTSTVVPESSPQQQLSASRYRRASPGPTPTTTIPVSPGPLRNSPPSSSILQKLMNTATKS